MKYPSPLTHHKNDQNPFSANPSLWASFFRDTQISTSPPQATGPKPVSGQRSDCQPPPPQEPLFQARFTGTAIPPTPNKIGLQPLVDKPGICPPLYMSSQTCNTAFQNCTPKSRKTLYWLLGNAVVTAVTTFSLLTASACLFRDARPLLEKTAYGRSRQPFRRNELRL